MPLAAVALSAGGVLAASAWLPVMPAPTGGREVVRTTVVIPWRGAAGPPGPVTLWRPAGPGPACPVLVYEPGLGGGRDENSVLCRELASHGFVVVAWDPEPTSADGLRPWGRGFLALRGRVGERSGLLRARLGQLRERGAPVDVPGRAPVDWSRIGVFGFSLGGAVALDAAARDHAIRAVANLDGLVFCCRLPEADCPLDELDVPPLFVDQAMPDWLGDELPDVPCPPETFEQTVVASESVIRGVLASVGGFRLVVPGSRHRDFTDAAFRRRGGPLPFRWPDADARRSHALASRHVREYFLMRLRGGRPGWVGDGGGGAHSLRHYPGAGDGPG